MNSCKLRDVLGYPGLENFPRLRSLALVTYLECKQSGRTIFIGPFAKEIDARAWFRHFESRYQLRRVALHEQRAKVLYAAHEGGHLNRCIGVFDDNAAAFAAAGRNGVVMHWRRSDCLSPDDPLPILMGALRSRVA